MSYGGWAPYVSVSKRREKAAKKMAALSKKGKHIQPVEISGNKITKSFWGKAWCEHLEQFSDYANRLPRGRTYARNGSVCHLDIQQGKIEAIVSGSALYNIEVTIDPLSKSHWKNIKSNCAGQVSSLLDLLQGKISDGVMEIVSNPKKGLFPLPAQIRTRCNCPDWADMCKHIAAVLYGVGARLDTEPQMLFLLRGVDHQELVNTKIELPKKSLQKPHVVGDLVDIFGIDIDDDIGDDIDDSTVDKTASVNVTKAKSKTKPKPKPKKIKKTSEKATTKAIDKKKALKSTAAKKPVSKIKTPVTTNKKHLTHTHKTLKPIKKASVAITTASQIQPKKKRAFSITAKGVIRLRKSLAMNYSQFARLVGVSPSTIKNWEAKEGKLNLKPEKLTALEEIKTFDRIAAWEVLDGI
ncbi:MAG: putative Zn finger protein/DNA-binding XRE family transcriptional regulator [Flavobacteriales bacterium]|jgi:uncharacterized Zn finger protein/DNA-binding XRE family transcriptional regulator